MPNTTCSLKVQELSLPVYLGWTDEERALQQTIVLDVEWHFPKPPRACHTDELDDTTCYAAIIEAIQKKTADQPFRLVEHLGQEIYHLIKSLLPEPSKISVKITKWPKISGFDGSVQFHFADS